MFTFTDTEQVGNQGGERGVGVLFQGTEFQRGKTGRGRGGGGSWHSAAHVTVVKTVNVTGCVCVYFYHNMEKSQGLYFIRSSLNQCGSKGKHASRGGERGGARQQTHSLSLCFFPRLPSVPIIAAPSLGKGGLRRPAQSSGEGAGLGRERRR